MKDHRFVPAVALFLTAALLAHGCERSRTPATSAAPADPAPQAPAPLPVVDEARVLAQAPLAQPAVAEVQPAVANEAAPAAGYDKPREPFDPVKVNGPLFTDPRWNTIDVALVISGEQLGYLEPCGCAGLENQKGGFKRRDTFLKQLRDERRWPLVLLDSGGLIRRYGPQQEIKYEAALQGLREMGYQAIGLGAEDLQQSTQALAAAALDDANPFVAANVGFDPDAIGQENIGQPSRVIEAGKHKIGVTAVLGDSYREQIRNPELRVRPAAEALAEVLPDLRKKCDLLVVLSYAPKSETQELARKFKEIDLIVTAGGADEPPAEPAEIEGARARLVEVGHKGMYVAVIGLAGGNPLRNTKPVKLYQRVPLDSRFADSPAMEKLFEQYQDNLQVAGLATLCPPPVVHPRASGPDDPRGHYVGSETCGGCHTKAHAKWSETGHAHATDSIAHATPPRMNDPECLSCHVTGWNPQEYFAYKTGFTNLEETPHLVANGCENCHGPGAAHVEAQQNDAPNAAEIRALMRLTREQAEKTLCLTCHDKDNSPEFDFESYWKQIEHPWRD